MHISFVSPSIENTPCLDLLESLQGISLYKVASLEAVILQKIKLDLIFFDATLGEENICQQTLLYQQQNTHPIKWLIVNPDNNIHQSLHYMQAGASGLIDSLCNKEKLQDCIQTVSKGQLYLEEDLIQILALRQIKQTLLPFSQLSPREFDIFCLLAEGYTIQTIAEFLSISAKTTFNCQTQLRKKLTIKNAYQILELAKKHGLVPLK
jgi:DNA-binding NarL/FixJ family response regulator